MTDKELLQEALESIKWLRVHLERDHECLHMKPAVSGITDWLNKTEAALCARLAQSEQEQMPTKIMGPNLEDVLNAAGFYKQREWVGLTYADLYFWGGELGLGELGKGVLRAVDAHLRKKNNG